MHQVEITQLTVYPVKSMRGIALESAVLTSQGLAHDRRFMVVRSDGRFVTQRELHRLALVHTRLDKTGIELSIEGAAWSPFPAETQAAIPFKQKSGGDECETLDQGAEISRWLTSALHSSDRLRLVRMAPGYVRPQGQPANLGKKTSTFFADAAPFLVANEASLEALNRELELRGHVPVPMNRFRPNIVLRGPGPFAEHQVAELSSEEFRLKFCHPCQRCVVTTIDQDTAAKHPDWQPYKTLRDINPMPGNERAPAFAHNAILLDGDGRRNPRWRPG